MFRYNRNRRDSRSLRRYRNRSRSSSRNSTRSTKQARPTDQISIQGTSPPPPAAIQDDDELIITDANPPPLDQEPLLPKSFRLDKARSKELRSWMTSAQKPMEAKQLRENFHPSFEKGSFDLKVPVLDPYMARRLKEVRGGEASKAEDKEKALVASQFKILDITKPILYLWGSSSASNDPVLINAAESALQLWGHAFHSITTQRRENVLHQTDPRFEALFRWACRGDGYLRPLLAVTSDPAAARVVAKSGRTGSGFTLHGNFNRRGSRPVSSFNRGSRLVSTLLSPVAMSPPTVGGRVRRFSSFWPSLTSDGSVLEAVSLGAKIPFLEVPYQNRPGSNMHFNAEGKEIGDTEVASLLTKGAIERVPLGDLCFPPVEHTNCANRSKRIGKQLMWGCVLRPGEV
ncbi:Uncharacterized protein APZ42_025044 [Daphnia magna]|uniref:Uncharacterized protein n=1 Tax=Daphnia magna TaxID=35525 RepID=A0A164TIB9_9CRUS|nr:Uncharacterized protein APZ42_025044 [Daphnia magna]